MLRFDYQISARVAPHVAQPEPQTITGQWSAYTAARMYCAANMPGYSVIPHGRMESPGLFRFECVNDNATLGAVLWARDVDTLGATP